MKLGLGIGYSGAQLQLPMELIQTAERLGFDSVWTAEAYGSDAVTPLAFIAARTDRIRLGTGIMQLAGRSPAMCADAGPDRRRARRRRPVHRRPRRVRPADRGGLVRRAVGPSRTGACATTSQIMRKIFDREAPVEHHGREISLPYTGEGATGLGKPLRSILHTNPALPIWLGSGSEATVKLTAELCDGWLPMHFVPGRMEHYRAWVEEGFRRAGGDRGWESFEIQAGSRRHAHRGPRRRRRGRPAAPEDGHRPVRRAAWATPA